MIDFHVHLDLYPNSEAVVNEVIKRRIHTLSVTTTPSAWEGTSKIATSNAYIKTALGLHPQLAHERFSELALFDTYLPDTMYVGEIGLDGGLEFKNYWQIQTMVFDHILAACQINGGRIMSIHSRRAVSRVLDSLDKFQYAGVPVLHWFAGSKRELSRAIDLGCWFSINSAMLISERSRSLIQEIPRSKILTETDGPFAKINGSSAKPWDVTLAVEYIAKLWSDISPEEVSYVLSSNLKSLNSSITL